MQRLLNTTLTVKQLLIAIVIMGFMVTPWGMLYQQKQQSLIKVQQSSPAISSVPAANSLYPPLPPFNQLGKAFILDNQAIRKLKTLVNRPTSASSNEDSDRPIQAAYKLNHMNALTQRCWLGGQSYVVGDIVKTPTGWVRCNPTQANPADSNQAMILAWKALY